MSSNCRANVKCQVLFGSISKNLVVESWLMGKGVAVMSKSNSVQLSSSQLFHLFFFAGSCPVASKYLWMSSSWVTGRQGWYLLYSMVYSPFPWLNTNTHVTFLKLSCVVRAVQLWVLEIDATTRDTGHYRPGIICKVLCLSLFILEKLITS